MSYSELVDIDKDLLSKLNLLTQQNEELVKNTTTLQKFFDKKSFAHEANLKKI